MFASAVILFSFHFHLKEADERLLREGLTVRGIITDKTQTKKTVNKGKNGYYYERTLHYRFFHHSKEYTGSNVVVEQLWDSIHEGDTIELAVDQNNPDRSRIRSPDVQQGFLTTLKFLSVFPLALGIISVIVSWVQKMSKQRDA